MKKISALVSCLLLMIGAVTAQTAQPEVGGRVLPQWLTGLLALICFLFLTFVAFLVKKAWCGGANKGRTSVESARDDDDYVMNDRSQYDTTLDTRSKDRNAYDTTLDTRSKDRNAYDTTLDTRSKDRNAYDTTLDTRSKDRNAYDTKLDTVRSRDDRNAYDNLGMDDTSM